MRNILWGSRTGQAADLRVCAATPWVHGERPRLIVVLPGMIEQAAPCTADVAGHSAVGVAPPPVPERVPLTFTGGHSALLRWAGRHRPVLAEMLGDGSRDEASVHCAALGAAWSAECATDDLVAGTSIPGYAFADPRHWAAAGTDSDVPAQSLAVMAAEEPTPEAREGTETLLAVLWREPFGGPVIRVDDNLLETGDTSLQTAQFMPVISDQLLFDLRLQTLTRTPPLATSPQARGICSTHTTMLNCWSFLRRSRRTARGADRVSEVTERLGQLTTEQRNLLRQRLRERTRASSAERKRPHHAA